MSIKENGQRVNSIYIASISTSRTDSKVLSEDFYSSGKNPSEQTIIHFHYILTNYYIHYLTIVSNRQLGSLPSQLKRCDEYSL